MISVSKRDMTIALVALILGTAIGMGIGVVASQGQLPGEITAGLISLGLITIGGIGTIVKILVDKLSADLQHNTQLTSQALGAATSAANHADERATLVQEVTREKLRADSAERVIHIIEGNPACLPCRQAINETINEWRVRRRIPSK